MYIIYTYLYIYIDIFIYKYVYIHNAQALPYSIHVGILSAQVIERLCPALAVYENVMAATHRTADKHGTLQKPCVEAGRTIFIYIYIFNIIYIWICDPCTYIYGCIYI